LRNVGKSEQLKLLRQQTTLASFGALALRSDNLDEILTEACHLVGQALGTDLAKVIELQEDGETLLVRAGVGWKPGVVGEVTVRATNDTLEGQVLRTGVPMVSPDLAAETRFGYPQLLSDNGVRGIVNVLIIGGQDKSPFGILEVDSRKPRQFTDDDIAFLRSYANLIAAAVDRMRIVGDLRDREARLRESMDRQEAALETGLIGFFEWHVAAETITGDKRFASFYGLTPEAALAGVSLETLLHIIHPDDRAMFAASVKAALTSLSDYAKEFRLVHASGDVCWIVVRGRCSQHEGGQPLRYAGTAVDVTASKTAQETLRRADAAEALQKTNKILEATVAERTRALTEANSRLKAEAEERERVEEALRQSQKMEAVGQLTGGLAHDFNNLLQGISGSLELVRTRVAQGRTGELDRYIETAMSSAYRAATLTQRLLAFSRRQTLAPEPTDLNQLAGGMEELLRRTVGPAIQIETSFAAEPWPTLCDPHQLESAVLNLVVNARDAMPDGGHLLIETANTVLRDRRGTPQEQPPQGVPQGEYVALSVADTGAGMTPEVIARAFDPFFTTKPIGQGTGLGLSMIYGFVQQSGGHVRLRSEVGQGTTVTIYLPRHLAAIHEAVEENTTALSPLALGSGVVLLVEDEPDVRMVVRDVLSDLGYAVLEAESGRAGLLIADSGVRIDLLLTDVGLPGGMNGRQLADAVRQRRPGLKVLFITGYADTMAVGNGHMEQGMQVMTKPFALETLAARVQGIING